MVDSTGNIVERYRYTPYGERTILDANFAEDADGLSDIDFAIGHQGLYHDAESGLWYNRARMLNPATGRFQQRDPLGYVDGMSVYAYYAGMLGALDPSGLDYWEIVKRVVASAFGDREVQDDFGRRCCASEIGLVRRMKEPEEDRYKFFGGHEWLEYDYKDPMTGVVSVKSYGFGPILPHGTTDLELLFGTFPGEVTDHTGREFDANDIEYFRACPDSINAIDFGVRLGKNHGLEYHAPTQNCQHWCDKVLDGAKVPQKPQMRNYDMHDYPDIRVF